MVNVPTQGYSRTSIIHYAYRLTQRKSTSFSAYTEKPRVPVPCSARRGLGTTFWYLHLAQGVAGSGTTFWHVYRMRKKKYVPLTLKVTRGILWFLYSKVPHVCQSQYECQSSPCTPFKVKKSK
jgi:hypothetical protein